MTTRADMLFITEMSVRYHRRRAAFLDIISSIMTLITIIGGAGAFLTLVDGDNTFIAQAATLILTLVGTVQMVFKIDASAAAHKQWLKQWHSMLYEIRTQNTPSEDQLSRWIEQRYQIESECIIEMRALQVDCRNRAVTALNLDADPIKLHFYHQWFMQVIPFERHF